MVSSVFMVLLGSTCGLMQQNTVIALTMQLIVHALSLVVLYRHLLSKITITVCLACSLLQPDSTSIFTDDLVWDGEGCSDHSNCCSEPSQPWLYRQIPLPASDDIETRICCDEASSDEDF